MSDETKKSGNEEAGKDDNKPKVKDLSPEKDPSGGKRDPKNRDDY